MKDCRTGTQFVFVALGAAFGLGNAMRFPALCLYYGGAFVIAYVIVLAAFALPLLSAELYIGGRMKNFSRRPAGMCRAWGAVRDAACINSAAITIYYITIISLLAVRVCTFYGSINAGYPSDIPEATPFFAALCCCALAFMLTRKSQSRARLAALSVCMQVVFFAAMAVRGMAEEGSLSALSYIFRTDEGAFADCELWFSALGQALLSLSLAAGVMPCLASEMPEGSRPARFTAIILCANFVGGILSSIATLSLAYSCGLLDGITNSGIDNAFNIFPAALSAAFGRGAVAGVVGSLFYAVLTLTAFVSALSLVRPLFLRLTAELSARSAALTLCACIFALGLPFSLGADYSVADYVCCNIVAPVVAVCECLCVASAYLRKNAPLSRFFGAAHRFTRLNR